MDAITTLAMSIQNPVLHEIGMILQNPLIYAGLIFGLVLLAERREKKRVKIILALALTFLLVSGIKHIIAKERPCVDMEWCPQDYSFPSMHAAIAFTLMTGFLNKKSYPLFLVFALFVACLCVGMWACGHVGMWACACVCT